MHCHSKLFHWYNVILNNNRTQVAKFTWGRLFALIGANEEEVGILKYLIL